MPLQFGGLFGALQVRETARNGLRKSRLLHGIVAPEPRADHLQYILLQLMFHSFSLLPTSLVPHDSHALRDRTVQSRPLLANRERLLGV